MAVRYFGIYMKLQPRQPILKRRGAKLPAVQYPSKYISNIGTIIISHAAHDIETITQPATCVWKSASLIAWNYVRTDKSRCNTFIYIHILFI